MWKSKRRFKRKSFGKLIKFFVLFSFLVLVFSIFFLFNSKFFSIKQIQTKIQQAECLDENNLKNSSNLLGQNYFFVNLKKTEETLKKKFICIKAVNFNKIFPDKIKLQAVGRSSFARIIVLKDKFATTSGILDTISTPSAKEKAGTFIVDNENIIFSQNKPEITLPTIFVDDQAVNIGKKLESNLFNNSLKILKGVQAFGVDVNQSIIFDEFFVINPENTKPKIIFRLTSNIDVQLASLQLILAEAKIDLKELEFIDLRFDKPIVKFTPKNYGQR